MTREPNDDDIEDSDFGDSNLGDNVEENDEQNPIEEIAAEFVERMRTGEAPTIEEYAARHPDIATEIHDLLPTVVAMEELKLAKEQPEKSRFLKGPKSLKKLGDYLILGEIGRGGMGIVYEAEQQSLGRHVAVKVLPRQSLLDDHRLERFEREAQTAARLHHTNIVPIFGVGEQDGYHYYVMQLIRGLGLDRIVKELRGEKPRTTPGTSSASIHALARDAASGLRNGQFQSASSSSSSSTLTTGSGSNGGSSSATAATRTSTISAAPGSTEPSADTAPEPTVEGSGSLGPAYWQSVARIGLQIADALSYAHSQGTLHRDIKPANLLLDGQGVVWVTDFGLAKAIEESNLTHTGDVVGTLQYMAPEQFYGEYDARTDIYCLGLTLYELLTLRPAFAGSTRSGLMHQVTEGRAAAPSKLRPGIPPDIETIVLKAINRERTHRYQSAEELREDLSRFLDDRPILARRTTPIQYVSRWCRRNKALAGAIAVAISAILGAATLGWTNYVNQRTINGKLIAANTLVQKNLSRSLKAFGGVFDHLAGPDVFQVVIRDSTTTDDETGETETVYQHASIPVASKKDAALLQKLLEVFGQFKEDNQNHPDLQQDTARANQKIGDIRMRLGELDKAAGAYATSISIYEELGAMEYAVEIATAQNQRGQVFGQQQMLDEARKAHNHVLTALEDENGEPIVTTNRGLYELARAHDFLGSWGIRPLKDPPLDGRRPPGPSRRSGRRGNDRRADGRRSEVSRRGDGRRGDGRRPPGRSSRSEGRRHREEYLGPERRVHHTRAQSLLGGLLAEDPDNVVFRLAMARSCRNYYGYLWLGRSARLREDKDEFLARFVISDAQSILEKLVADYPEVALYKYELVETLIAGQSFGEDTTELDRALTIARKLQINFPSSSYGALTSRILQHLSSRYRRHDRVREEGALRESVTLLEDLVKRFPDKWTYLEQLSGARRHFAEVLFHGKGDDEAAHAQATKMIAEGEKVIANSKPSSRRYDRMARWYGLHARVLRALDRDDEADAADAASKASEAKAHAARGRK
jgi:serine/threonine protein kinase